MPAHPFADRFAPHGDVAYLNAASQGPLPLAAAQAGREALAMKERPWGITSRTYVSITGEVRSLAARLLGARDEQVALVTGAGAVVNGAARGLELGAGDEVLLPPHEFPSNDYPWRWLARRGVAVRTAEPDDPSGALSAEGLAAAIGPRTRVVAFAHVSYLHGGLVDPGPVVEAARRVGALTVVDGSQAAGALPFDFAASGVDVYAVSGYKFLLGPYGTGVGVFSPRALDRLAVGDVNWWTVVGADDFNRLPAEIRLEPGARRWDAHETASFNNLFPLAESLRLLVELGPAAVQAHARSLLDGLEGRLPPGFAIASPRPAAQRSHVLCVRASSPGATQEAFDRLRAARVYCALRGDRIRVAPHVYNGGEHVERLLATLAVS